MEKVIHFHMMLPVSEFKSMWMELLPCLLLSLLSFFLTHTIKWKHLQSKGTTWGEMSAPHTRWAQLPSAHTFHSLVTDAVAAKSTSRVAINTLGPSGVRDPEGSQTGHGLIARGDGDMPNSDRITALGHFLLYSHPPAQRPRQGLEKQLPWVDVRWEVGFVQSCAQQFRELRHVGAPSGACLRG